MAEKGQAEGERGKRGDDAGVGVEVEALGGPE